MIQVSVDLELICFQFLKIPQTFTNMCRGSFHFGVWGCRSVPIVYCCLLRYKFQIGVIQLPKHLLDKHPEIPTWSSTSTRSTSGSAWATSAAVLFSCSLGFLGPWLSPSKLAVSDCLGSLFLSCVFYLVCIFGHPYWLKGVAPLQWFSATELICQGPSKVSCSSFFAPASRRPARLLIAK